MIREIQDAIYNHINDNLNDRLTSEGLSNYTNIYAHYSNERSDGVVFMSPESGEKDEDGILSFKFSVQAMKNLTSAELAGHLTVWWQLFRELVPPRPFTLVYKYEFLAVPVQGRSEGAIIFELTFRTEETQCT